MKENYWKQKTYLQESSISGTGRFAQNAIQKGALIGIIGGSLVEASQVVADKTGLYPITKDLYLKTDPTFINHSCQPSSLVKDTFFIIAAKDIAIGEEITLDYSSFVYGEGELLFECNCLSPNCRKEIYINLKANY